MKKKYFDQYEFKRCSALAFTNPIASELAFREYVSSYPKDYSAYPYYINTLIYLGKFKEASVLLNKVVELKNSDTSYMDMPNKVTYFNCNMLYSKIKLLSYQNRYQELYELCIKNIHELKKADINVSRIIHYAKKKLGILKPCSREDYTYFYRQVADYKEEDLIEHLAVHKVGSERSEAIFNPDVDINKLIYDVKSNIDKKNTLYCGFCEDLYFFKYDNCGTVNGKNTDFVRVICTHDTKDIITLYPSLEGEHMPHVNLSYLNNTYSKVKRLNQIDKFYLRYEKK